MSNLVKLAIITEIRPGQMLRVVHNEHAYLLSNVGGEILATDDLCTHEDASLALGALHDDCVSCPLHGSRFNLRTGEPLEEPATEGLQTYPVEIRENDIFVEI